MAYHDEHVSNLASKRIQVDEIWSFVYSKQANAPHTKSRMEGRGNCWTWTALNADNKLMVTWYVGYRDGDLRWPGVLQDVAVHPEAQAAAIRSTGRGSPAEDTKLAALARVSVLRGCRRASLKHADKFTQSAQA